MRCLELFAGAGGAALGLEAAGIEHVALCEWDPDACATLRAAGLGPVVEGDVRDLDAIEAVAGAGPVDLLWSSFPCQAFSTAGKRLGASDERNGWPWSVDAIDRFRPRWFLAENVYGLLTHSEEGHPNPMHCPRCYFETVILAELRERFEFVGWWLLDAADYGVPQHRRRVIIWAGPTPVRAPVATHAAPNSTRQGTLFGGGVKPWVTMAEALGVDPSACVATDSWAKNREQIGITGPAHTITVRVGRADPWTSSGVPFIIDKTRRPLSVTEAAVLQGFQPNHKWQGAKTAHYRQIGNAVPPKLAEVVGRAIIEADTK